MHQYCAELRNRCKCNSLSALHLVGLPNKIFGKIAVEIVDYSTLEDVSILFLFSTSALPMEIETQQVACDGGTCQRGYLGVVIGRGYLDDIHADDVEAGQRH